MANAEQLALLKAGVEGWNQWRIDKSNRRVDIRVDLRGADLKGSDLRGALLNGANLQHATLCEANLWRANLWRTELSGADLRNANLRKANLVGAVLRAAALGGADLWSADLWQVDLTGADLTGANFSEAVLHEANFTEANLAGVNLAGADLSSSNLVRANIDKAQISKSNVYGVNVWDLKGEFQGQKDLIITPWDQPSITVDNIKVAQFVYLILNNKEIRDVINTLTSKSVLILGRFGPPERKAVLDELRNKLREYNLLPIVFDFERPDDKDYTETVQTLAGLSLFVIVDVTNPKSTPLEMEATVKQFKIPYVPIIDLSADNNPFAMMVDLQKNFHWVLQTFGYHSKEELLENIDKAIIYRALEKHNELSKQKAKEPEILTIDDLIRGKDKK